jgi:hypothetical protein
MIYETGLKIGNVRIPTTTFSASYIIVGDMNVVTTQHTSKKILNGFATIILLLLNQILKLVNQIIRNPEMKLQT